ncbi:hypothetical protein FQZ97_1080400 [compost metagenome]
MHLHRGFRVLLQPAHVVHHPFDVLQHVAAAHHEHFEPGPTAAVLVAVPGGQRFDPVLDRRALVFADFVEVVQGIARVEQRAPVVETPLGVQQLGLPVVELAREFAAQFQIAVHHLVDDAQHQVGRVGWQVHARGA